MKRLLGILSVLVYLLLIFLYKDRASVELYFFFNTTLFGLYVLFAFFTKPDLKETLFWAFVFRIVYIVAFPVLSDDLYRFIWDGFLTTSGSNPYLYLPSRYEGEVISELFEKLNSPDYYSLYPPLKQFFFAFSVWLGNVSIFKSMIALRLLLIMAGMANIILIYKIAILRGFSKAKSNHVSALFGLSPFVIIETVGNFHFEGLMFSFLLMSYYLYKKQDFRIGSAVFFGLAVSIKLLPLIFLPLIWRKLGLKKGLVFIVIAGLLNVLLFLPFFEIQLISNVLSSIDLYFHSFEFNASLYYLIRELGFMITGYNAIQYSGTALAIISFFSILWFSCKIEKASIASLFILSVYFLCTTTMHPWYLITLFGLSLFTPYKFPLVWTFTISLSYFAYGQTPVSENTYFLLLEYGTVFFVAYIELKNKRSLF